MYSLFLYLQLFFEALSGGVYAAFYCSQREGEFLGYFVVFIAGDVQTEGCAKVGGQLLYHPAQFFECRTLNSKCKIVVSLQDNFKFIPEGLRP